MLTSSGDLPAVPKLAAGRSSRWSPSPTPRTRVERRCVDGGPSVVSIVVIRPPVLASEARGPPSIREHRRGRRSLRLRSIAAGRRRRRRGGGSLPFLASLLLRRPRPRRAPLRRGGPPSHPFTSRRGSGVVAFPPSLAVTVEDVPVARVLQSVLLQVALHVLDGHPVNLHELHDALGRRELQPAQPVHRIDEPLVQLRRPPKPHLPVAPAVCSLCSFAVCSRARDAKAAERGIIVLKLLREDAKVGHARWMPPVAYSAELPSGAGHRVGQVPRVGAHLRVDLLSQLMLRE